MFSKRNNVTTPPHVNPGSQIVTLQDLIEFETHFLVELKKLLKEFGGQPVKKWLKSLEVRKLLGISPNTLTSMRVNGKLPFTKIGGVIYYDYEDIQDMFQKNKGNTHQ